MRADMNATRQQQQQQQFPPTITYPRVSEITDIAPPHALSPAHSTSHPPLIGNSAHPTISLPELQPLISAANVFLQEQISNPRRRPVNIRRLHRHDAAPMAVDEFEAFARLPEHQCTDERIEQFVDRLLSMLQTDPTDADLAQEAIALMKLYKSLPSKKMIKCLRLYSNPQATLETQQRRILEETAGSSCHILYPICTPHRRYSYSHARFSHPYVRPRRA